MEKSYEINLDIKKEMQIPYIEFVNGDLGNAIYLNIFDDGSSFDLTGKTASISLLKQDENIIVAGAEIIGTNKVRYELGSNDISCTGSVLAEIQIHESNKRLTTVQFQYFVRDDIDTANAVQSSTELPILTDLINQVKALDINKLVKIAGVDISGHRAVMLDANDKIVYADNTIGKVIGLSLNASNVGGSVDIQTIGEIEDISFNFVSGQSIYLASNGLITQQLPTSGYLIDLGYAVTTNKIFLDIKQSIKLN